MIAVTGASGKTGRAVVEALTELGHSVRALVGRRDQEEAARALGPSEVLVGDLTDRDSLASAVAGCRLVYHICPNMRADEEEIGERVIDLARRQRVERFVYHSVLHPQIEAMPHHWKKLRVEERLIESGLRFTILQPSAYMQNLKAQWPAVVARGRLEVPYSPATRLAMVDLRDVAEAAARVIADATHEGAIYELCGPEALDQHQVAGVLAGELGRPVEVIAADRRKWAEGARAAGLTEYAVTGLLAMFRHYERHGLCGSPRVLEGLLGRPATRLRQVVPRWVERARTGQRPGVD